MVDRIEAAVDQLDQKNSRAIDEAWSELRPLGYGVAPYLRAAFPRFRHSAGRCALVYYATRYARIGGDAAVLGLVALGDRSKVVRYRACGLLAYSLNTNALVPLAALRDDPDWHVRQASAAATFAIRERNHHLFVDRRGEGMTNWEVNPGDGESRRVSLLTRLRMKAVIEHRLE